MRQAIEKTRAGILAGQTPFGASIVRHGEILCVAHNSVWRDCDPTAHAEVNAIRQAARQLGTIDLSECTMFTTCEPCPMCLGAIHWAKIQRLVYGASIADAAAAGFNELRVDAAVLVKMGQSQVKIETGQLCEECRGLFRLWKESAISRAY